MKNKEFYVVIERDEDGFKILHGLSYDYVYNKGGVTPFHDQEDSQILRLLTKCFAK